MTELRLFVALPFPGAARRALARVGADLAARWKPGRSRVVPEEQIHLTLRFFGPGPDPERMEERLRAALPVGPDPMRLAVTGLGAFPSPRRARVAFAAVAERDGDRLPNLHAACERVAREAGLPAARRRFAPHVTLVRLRRPLALRRAVREEAARGLPREEIPVPEARLVASTLTPAGAIHRLVARFPLATP